MLKIIKLISINFLVLFCLIIIGFSILEIIISDSENQVEPKGSLIFDHILGWDSNPPVEEIEKKKSIKKNYVYWRFFYS